MSIQEHASDSTEAFDNICEMCEVDDEIEAVRFCRQCRQYMCLKCAQGHLRTNSSKCHVVMNKTDLEALKPSTSLFERQIAPLTAVYLPDCNKKGCGYKDIPDHFCRDDAAITGLYSTKGSSKFVVALQNPLSQTITYWKENFHSNIERSNIEIRCSKGTGISSQCCVDTKTQNVYITRSEEKQVHVLSENMTKSSLAFRTYGECHGIASFDSGLAVSMNIDALHTNMPKWQVHFVDFNGNVKSRVLYDKQGKALFGEPMYLASNVSETVLYVCDVGAKAVLAIDVLGTTLFVFKEPNCISLRGLSVDNEDRLYVVCRTQKDRCATSSNILQITKDGKQRRNIITYNRLPENVWFDRNNDFLAVLVDGRNATVYIFLA